MNQIKEYKFDSRDDLFGQLLRDIMATLSLSLKNNARASMLLSGGTSPGALYEMMSQQTLDWANVWFGLSDERWVAPDHADSNEKLVRETLLTHRAAGANFIGLKVAGEDIAAGQKASDQRLQALPRPFDITLLGMGLDGHTASLFPDSADTAAALSEGNKMLCHPIRRGENETPRMTMTLNALLGSHEIKLLIFGEEKWQVYEQARSKKSAEQPVSYLLHQTQTPVSVYWTP
ncbi:MAG: 6-phosphogluconolactonase [Alphaproteobacteria bacterium]|nr:MAG: 6-phosphogluconolactonase [Alphaproteobacteria bacterium]